jgi:outer membrane protein assembly factor BamA
MAQVDNAAPKDTVQKLPFAIADEKKLPDEDLENKKEGAFVTGAPELSSDPINGFGYGVEGIITFNGKKKDPFFAYTPYRAELGLVLFNTTKNQREFAFNLDVPYIFDTKWRLRASGAYEVNPNLLYFGVTTNSLKSLDQLAAQDQLPGQAFSGNSYSSYEASLQGNNYNYNRYTKEEYILNVSLEHSYLDGKLRVLGGYEFAYLNVNPFGGNSRLQKDFQSGGIVGVGGMRISMLQAGLIYDTRDLEPDPSHGVFAEITDELSANAFGSKFNFNKTFAQVKVYEKLLPGVFKRMVFAGRLGMGYTAGDAPFFEYQDEWSSEGSIEGLGGPTTLRGYKQSRFLGRLMDFSNIELRTRFAQFDIFKQNIALSAVPFFDIGGVWDSFSTLYQFQNYRYDEGLGLRIAWNVTTILRFDYAISKEDNQFFFNFNHAF